MAASHTCRLQPVAHTPAAYLGKVMLCDESGSLWQVHWLLSSGLLEQSVRPVLFVFLSLWGRPGYSPAGRHENIHCWCLTAVYNLLRNSRFIELLNKNYIVPGQVLIFLSHHTAGMFTEAMVKWWLSGWRLWGLNSWPQKPRVPSFCCQHSYSCSVVRKKTRNLSRNFVVFVQEISLNPCWISQHSDFKFLKSWAMWRKDFHCMFLFTIHFVAENWRVVVELSQEMFYVHKYMTLIPNYNCCNLRMKTRMESITECPKNPVCM